jgi:hypothetical protein
MKETELLEKKLGKGLDAEGPFGNLPVAPERFQNNRGPRSNSLRTRYNQEAITQPLRRSSDDDILPPGRH